MEINFAAILFVSVLGLGLVSTRDSFLDTLADARDAWKSPKEKLDACMAKEGVSEDLMRDLSNISVTELPQQGNCFLACGAEKFELVVDGKMSVDNIMQFLRIAFAMDPAKSAQRLALAETAANACADEAGARKLDRCELAGRMRTCYLKALTPLFEL